MDPNDEPCGNIGATPVSPDNTNNSKQISGPLNLMLALEADKLRLLIKTVFYRHEFFNLAKFNHLGVSNE